MPIKKDGRGKRWVEMELLVPGTPEQVWHALATGSGMAGWFVKAEIEPHVGGAFRLIFGPGAESSGAVTGWEPPHQFAYVERDWETDAPPVATEITITGRSGDQCLVRMVHSLFTSSDDWDDQLEGFEEGWVGFFEVLRIYLGHFAGAEAASFMATTSTPGTSLAAWVRLGEALGLTGANVGESRQAADGPEAWTGVVAHVHQDARQRFALLRLEAPSPGVALVSAYDTTSELSDMEVKVGKDQGTNVGVCRYFYGEGADGRAAEAEVAWREWLAATFGGGEG